MSHAHNHWFLGVAIVACAVAALVDLRTGQIPNWLTLGLFCAAPFARAGAVLAHHQPWASAVLVALYSLLSGVASALIPLALARGGGLGLGDVKLFAAIGAACGVFVALYAQTYAYVFAMIHALVLATRKKKLGVLLANVKSLFDRSRRAPGDRASGDADDPDFGSVDRSGGSQAARHDGFTEVKFGPAILGGICMAAWAQWKW